ncbi:hypothetical protein FNZ56_03010 [Pseudoluteimonas lycopersici]|uniref:Phytase-like domain-containing protein n=1 Tax=Pseudoluteimonas lycopersici TaxID=1324796 RepID=A0A516V308_9GAMM|nr:hypothetical protein [Lysobacter lycopersici]QDQ72918.1 hypothetical protein FNZ56_03010 [Lysobacter lycopersici]
MHACSHRFALAFLILPLFSIGGIASAAERGTAVGLGRVLTAQGGGQIFGFDINQAGDEGVLASSVDLPGGGRLATVETFDQDTGRITKTVTRQQGNTSEYGVDGIFAGDVALLTHYVTPRGSIFPKRFYETMNPVTAQQINGTWTPPLANIDVLMAGTDQSTDETVLFVIELKRADRPSLVVTDIAANTSKAIPLDPALFGIGNSVHLAQYTAANQAVLALSPDAGTVRGRPPVIALVDLDTGAMERFDGYNNGFFHSGFVNGLAVDPETGIAATTTELNSQVEFYDLNTKTGIKAVQLPCTTDTDQVHSGSNIAVDPVNKLFLVTETTYCDGRHGSAIVVYDEAGNFVEAITGFNFAIGEPAPVLNPSKRMGWVFSGPEGFSQLQQFFY